MAVMLLAWLCVAEPLSNRAGNSRAKDDEERAVKIDAASSALAQAWNTQAQAIPQQAQVAAASVQDERPYDLSVHVDAGPDMTQYLNQISDDSRRLNATFDTLAPRYAAAKDNALALGKMVLDGVTLDLSKVTIPVYLQSAREDHIAPAKSVFKATRLFGGPVRFIIAGSGHIAGVINPPAANKYQYWTNDRLPASIDEWRAQAVEHAGSWWPDWDAWLAARSGKQVPARKPGDGGLPVLGDAPGTYVKVKAQ